MISFYYYRSSYLCLQIDLASLHDPDVGRQLLLESRQGRGLGKVNPALGHQLTFGALATFSCDPEITLLGFTNFMS